MRKRSSIQQAAIPVSSQHDGVVILSPLTTKPWGVGAFPSSSSGASEEENESLTILNS
jgi:hypothetical protein